MRYLFGIHGSGMHNYMMMEIELGSRVAACQDSEDCGFDAILDLQVEQDIRDGKFDLSTRDEEYYEPEGP